MLLLLGWDIETANQANLTGKIDDTIWVKHARKTNRIAITFDELAAKQGETISRELRRHGGKIIRVQGGPEQDLYRAVGKIIYHYSNWYSFFKVNNGVSVISDLRPQSCKNYLPEAYHQKYHHLDAEQFTKYLEATKLKPYKPRGHKTQPPPLNQGLLT